MYEPTRFPGKEKTGIHKKKEGRFNPSGQVSMRQRRTDSVLVPRSNVHIHSVTLGESVEVIKKLNCNQRITRITTAKYKMDSYNGLLPYTTTYFHLMDYQQSMFLCQPEII